MSEDLSKLPPPEKKVVAKELVKAGYSTRTIEDWLKADHATIARWALEDTPEEMRQYATDFHKQIEANKTQGIALGVRRIQQLLPREKRLDQVIKTLEYLEGKQGGSNVQINNMIKIE
jgi:hypothetical protein